MKEIISRDQIDHYAAEAATAANYSGGFGLAGCDLSKPGWWAAYTRQSLEEQALNNRLSDYLRTSA